MKNQDNLLISGQDVWVPRKDYEDLKRKADLYDRMTRIFHVYECQDCVVTFAVEQDFQEQSDICCPNCLDGRDVEEKYGKENIKISVIASFKNEW